MLFQRLLLISDEMTETFINRTILELFRMNMRVETEEEVVADSTTNVIPHLDIASVKDLERWAKKQDIPIVRKPSRFIVKDSLDSGTSYTLMEGNEPIEVIHFKGRHVKTYANKEGVVAEAERVVHENGLPKLFRKVFKKFDLEGQSEGVDRLPFPYISNVGDLKYWANQRELLILSDEELEKVESFNGNRRHLVEIDGQFTLMENGEEVETISFGQTGLCQNYVDRNGEGQRTTLELRNGKPIYTFGDEKRWEKSEEKEKFSDKIRRVSGKAKRAFIDDLVENTYGLEKEEVEGYFEVVESIPGEVANLGKSLGRTAVAAGRGLVKAYQAAPDLPDKLRRMTLTEKAAGKEATRAYELITKARDVNGINAARPYLRSFLELVEDSKQRDIYDADEVARIVGEQVAKTVYSGNRSSVRPDLVELINNDCREHSQELSLGYASKKVAKEAALKQLMKDLAWESIHYEDNDRLILDCLEQHERARARLHVSHYGEDPIITFEDKGKSKERTTPRLVYVSAMNTLRKQLGELSEYDPMKSMRIDNFREFQRLGDRVQTIGTKKEFSPQEQHRYVAQELGYHLQVFNEKMAQAFPHVARQYQDERRAFLQACNTAPKNPQDIEKRARKALEACMPNLEQYGHLLEVNPEEFRARGEKIIENLKQSPFNAYSVSGNGHYQRTGFQPTAMNRTMHK